ncbi:MAG: putative prophage CPS-53 integrase [Candidatus Accumulibacter vicinus]|uniref:Putative prophage CPS-53 integrase n=2 Tax=Candidatus Accumulibacter vicinus TaxID=2954382 RepID=A0A084Y3I1_9PROT|nr:MAG: putative prophage CPS-53 integrase [Candidatus Accumulibacter vicinus]
MTNRENFTAGRVAAFRFQPSAEGKNNQTVYWDGKAPGLGLRVTFAGTKTYVFESRLNGKTIRLSIGDVRTWTVGDAQAEATRLKMLTDQGIDPRQQKAQHAAAAAAQEAEFKRGNVTVGAVWNCYVEARRPKWSVRHLADHQKLAYCGDDKAHGALAALMPLKMTEIDSERVKAWLRDESARRPTQAALAFRLFRAFLNWCAETPEYHSIANATVCQARIVKEELPKKHAKDDCLQREQLPAWFSAVRTISNPVISAYLQVLLLVGARREELAGLKWEDVDFRWQSITIHDKVEGERTIPLTPFVAALLTRLPRRNEWVFSSPLAASGRLREPSIQHRRVCAIAGIDGLTLHGLRRSFGTLSEWVECPVGVAAQIMGHKPSATAEKHYRVRPLDLLRSWHVKIESWMLEQAGIEFEHSNSGLRMLTAV